MSYPAIPIADADTFKKAAKALSAARSTVTNGLPVFTIYRHPLDAPDDYVMRLFAGEHITDVVFRAANIETLRDIGEKLGLTRLPRFPGDDANIVETWL